MPIKTKEERLPNVDLSAIRQVVHEGTAQHWATVLDGQRRRDRAHYRELKEAIASVEAIKSTDRTPQERKMLRDLDAERKQVVARGQAITDLLAHIAQKYGVAV